LKIGSVVRVSIRIHADNAHAPIGNAWFFFIALAILILVVNLADQQIPKPTGRTRKLDSLSAFNSSSVGCAPTSSRFTTVGLEQATRVIATINTVSRKDDFTSSLASKSIAPSLNIKTQH
jgi:hypothetical protein